MKKIELSSARKIEVYESIRRSSDPNGSFFLLVAVSTLIAAFGLVMNSTAVVIGAMLVAPLMTPILGMALALVRGDTQLLGIASRSEIAGVVVAIVASMCLGVIVPYFEPTPEMLGRTQPNLFDLLVAVFAGLAGAYALVDERLSPVLPGVAISTAIVPPLANVGLSLSLGAYQGAWGSFLLFFTNFLSILLVSSAVFIVAGMAEEIHTNGRVLVRRFGVAIVGFITIAVMLGGELLRILEERRIANEFQQALQEELVTLAIDDMKRLTHTMHDGRIVVLAEVNGPKEPTPRQTQQAQERLSDIAGMPVELYLRTAITHDISASGAIGQGLAESMNGFYSSALGSQRIARLQMAEQTVREHLDQVLGVHLDSIDSVPVNGYTIYIAALTGFRNLYPDEIETIQAGLQARLGNEQLWFIANQKQTALTDAMGGVRAEFMGLEFVSESQQAYSMLLGETARSWLEQREFWIESWSNSLIDGKNIALFEVKGPVAFSDADLEALTTELTRTTGEEIKIYVRSRIETVHGSEQKIPYETLLQQLMQQSQAQHPEKFRRLLERMR